MKISLRWVFDHIVGKLESVDVVDFVSRFIKTTAEIEEWKKVTLDVGKLTLAQVISVDKEGVILNSPEHDKKYCLQGREDIHVGAWYLLEIAQTTAWATSVTLGGTKEMLLPSIAMEHSLQDGGWKKHIEHEDYIIDIDNKSINHRPDLWGHRGIARELAAIFDMTLVPIENMVLEKKIQTHETSALVEAEKLYTLSIEKESGCDRFAALYLPSVHVKASVLSMVTRLSRLDNRSINFLVDSTNYVMLDLGQPMHAFDAETIVGGLTVRKAHSQEKLSLLDGQTITLNNDDIVVADNRKAVSLAGIMGGTATGISVQTNAILLEAAHFDATTIRKTSMYHKKRTESSMRFEKNIDPVSNCQAIQRFLFLLDAESVEYHVSDNIVSVGTIPQTMDIVVLHSFIERCLGVVLKPNQVVTILQKLFFEVNQKDVDDDVQYHVTVPSWRAIKDVRIAEDVVEEIGRFIGYDSIPQILPLVRSKSSDLQHVYRLREIKQLLSYGFSMREICGYAFFDESFLKQLSWDPIDYVSVKNPVSEIHSRLVTTLQPQLLKAVAENSIHSRKINFYEWGRVWHKRSDNVEEKKSLVGILYDQDGKFDFYDGKSLVVRLFDMLNLKSVVWRQGIDNVQKFSWLAEHKSATLMHHDHVLGHCGIVDEHTVASITSGGSAFIFEFDGDYLLEFVSEVHRFESLPKYPSVRRDISMLIPVSIAVDTLIEAIKAVDRRIESVTLIDFFEKKEWKNKRSVAFHVELRDNTKTLEHDEVESLWETVVATLLEQGAIIR